MVSVSVSMCSCGNVNDNAPYRHCKRCHADGARKYRNRKSGYQAWLEEIAANHFCVSHETLRTIWEDSVLETDSPLKKTKVYRR